MTIFTEDDAPSIFLPFTANSKTPSLHTLVLTRAFQPKNSKRTIVKVVSITETRKRRLPHIYWTIGFNPEEDEITAEQLLTRGSTLQFQVKKTINLVHWFKTSWSINIVSVLTKLECVKSDSQEGLKALQLLVCSVGINTKGLKVIRTTSHTVESSYESTNLTSIWTLSLRRALFHTSSIDKEKWYR